MNTVNAERIEEKSTFERFKFKSKEEVESKINELGLELKSSNNIDVLLKPVTLKNNITIRANALLYSRLKLSTVKIKAFSLKDIN